MFASPSVSIGSNRSSAHEAIFTGVYSNMHPRAISGNDSVDLGPPYDEEGEWIEDYGDTQIMVVAV